MKSSLPFTSVVSYHTNPLTCGVAKFSKILADRLGVPFVGCSETGRFGVHPLLSLKWSEVSDSDHLPLLWSHLRQIPYSLFWHDAGSWLTANASHVFYADPSLGSPGLWCPSLIETRKPLRLFSFGMGHKLQVDRYEELRAALGDRPFQLRVSVGLHEGMTLDDATKNIEPLTAIVGQERVRFLGCLSDESIVEELHQADYAVAFFERGARMNNTTIHAAMDAGVPVIGNYDADTSGWLKLRLIQPRQLRVDRHGWNELITEMERVCASSRLPVAR